MAKHISTWQQGTINNEEEKYYGLAQGNILDGFLYRTLRRNWLFNTGGNIVTKTDSAGPKPNSRKSIVSRLNLSFQRSSLISDSP